MHTVGATGGSTGVPGAKKRFFPKLFLDHLGCKQVFLARFEPEVTRIGLRKISKCLEDGPFWDHR